MHQQHPSHRSFRRSGTGSPIAPLALLFTFARNATIITFSPPSIFAQPSEVSPPSTNTTPPAPSPPTNQPPPQPNSKPKPAPVTTSPINPAAQPAPAPKDPLLAAARLQTLLARRGFSPGLIDGKPGRKTRTAIEFFQRSRKLPITGEADTATLTALAQEDPLATTTDTWQRPYTLTNKDVALITGPIPEDWNERAQFDVSGYSDTHELLAERGWCSLALVTTLNPGIDLTSLSEGDSVNLPDTRAPSLPPITRLEIDLSEKYIVGYNADDLPVFLTHCSIAKSAEKRPAGRLTVKVIAANPDYTFNPKDWPEVTNVTSKLRIAPGPRNPVGAAWIGLDKPGYGIHGTVRPQDIGKTGSHGCFRSLNWEALRLAHAVKAGTPVDVKD